MANKIIQIISHDGDLLGLSDEGKVYIFSKNLEIGDYFWNLFVDTLDASQQQMAEEFERYAQK